MWACPSPRLGRVNSPDTRRQLEGAESPSHSGQEDRALSELLTTCNSTFLTVFLCSPPATKHFLQCFFLTTYNNIFLTVFLFSPSATKHFQQCFFSHHNKFLTMFLFSPPTTIHFYQCFFSHHQQQYIFNSVSLSRHEPFASACLSSTRQWREISTVIISSIGPLL